MIDYKREGNQLILTITGTGFALEDGESLIKETIRSAEAINKNRSGLSDDEETENITMKSAREIFNRLKLQDEIEALVNKDS